MARKILYFTLFVSLLLTSKLAEAQPNDFQCTPNNLGFLPLASPPCSSSAGVSYGSPVSAAGSTLFATNDSLSGYLTSCYSGPPLKDVWFTFNATEAHVEVQIQGAGATPLSDSYVAIYEALTGECVGLIPRECSLGSGTGLHTMDFGPLTLGVQYYLQVASGIAGGNGTFTMVIRSKTICSDCSKNSVLNAYPLPVNAAYPPDTTVGFCYSVIGYNELFGNGFHGMVPLFGSGWDASTLTIYDAADSADFLGQWKWFSNIDIGGTSGIVSGFFYDIGGDGDPTNNLGDHGTFSTIWTFCFTIKTQTAALCSAGQNDLSIRFLNYADGESGSLVSTYDCSGDEDYVLDAHMECCPKPFGVFAQAAGCNSTPDGSIVAYAGFSAFGYIYELYNSVGSLVSTFTSPPFSTTPYTFTGLLEGNYYWYFHENVGGACQTGYNVYVPGPVTYDIQQTVFGCPSSTSCTNSAQVLITSGAVTSVTWSNGETGFIADSLCTGWNYVTIVDTGSVACFIFDSVYITNSPFASPYFDYNQSVYCTSDSFAVLSDFPAAAGGTFSIVTAPPGINSTDLNSSTGTVDISGATFSGFLIIKYSSPPPCIANYTDTMNIEISPPPPLTSIFPCQYLCTGDVANPYSNTSSFNVEWYSDPTLGALITTQMVGNSFDFFSGIPFTGPGLFSFYLVNTSTTNSCKSAVLPVTVTVYPTPVVDAGPSLTVCPGFGINLNCTTGPSTFSWSPASVLTNPNIANPVANISSTTLFTVVATDASSGCSSSDTVTVFVDDNGTCDIVIYNGFTPNGDNNNDFWFIDGISVDRKNQVYIFNRWGDKVWETTGYNNIDNRWEGKTYKGKNLVPDGTYFYIIHFQDKDYKGYIELTK